MEEDVGSSTTNRAGVMMKIPGRGRGHALLVIADLSQQYHTLLRI